MYELVVVPKSRSSVHSTSPELERMMMRDIEEQIVINTKLIDESLILEIICKSF